MIDCFSQIANDLLTNLIDIRVKLINKEITKVFDESQIYRIDHYLGKELIARLILSLSGLLPPLPVTPLFMP